MEQSQDFELDNVGTSSTTHIRRNTSRASLASMTSQGKGKEKDIHFYETRSDGKTTEKIVKKSDVSK